ncbi:hypothetical protein ACTQYZ_08690 [Anaerofustis sp. LCP19S3_F7]|uniref:hypothetical protein n=1 Tax=Anaerofustis sp. LCP19S3_F7 TaxID=3440247 RepID=UPI003F91D006
MLILELYDDDVLLYKLPHNPPTNTELLPFPLIIELSTVIFETSLPAKNPATVPTHIESEEFPISTLLFSNFRFFTHPLY